MINGWRVSNATEARTAAPVKIRKKENVMLLTSISDSVAAVEGLCSSSEQWQKLVRGPLIGFAECVQAVQGRLKIDIVGEFKAVKAAASQIM